MKVLIVTAIILITLAVAFPKHAYDSRYKREMVAAKAITTIHSAETDYYSQYGQYATSLKQLGPPASGVPGPNSAGLIDRDLATGEKGGFKFALQQSPTGYILMVNPISSTAGTHTYYSDQSMAIHVHSGQEPATANDGLLGESRKQLQQTAPAAAPAP